jgi:SAM-dependent methyltransferase
VNRPTAYATDLAYIHHAGFSDFARSAAPGLRAILRRNRVRSGLVVDLGCGSGVLARELTAAAYDVLGVDLSPAMTALARRHAPRGRFVTASLANFDLPPCDAVLSIGECLNYTFDGPRTLQSISGLFRRVYGALRPGGVFVFDAAGRLRAPRTGTRRGWWQGDDWAVLVETKAGRGGAALIRAIDCYRKIGKRLRHSREIHVQRLFEPGEIASRLQAAGFEVQASDRYGRVRLPEGLAAFIARKPAR